MPLVFLPEPELLFLWGREPVPHELSALTSASGEPHAAPIVTPSGLQQVEGAAFGLLAALQAFAAVPAALVPRLAGSLAAWVLAGKVAVDLVSRERVIPTIQRRRERIEARWAAALAASEDADRVAALARSFPAAAHAVPVGPESGASVWAPEVLLRAFLNAAVDALVRAARGAPEPPRPGERRARRATAAPVRWDQRWRSALAGAEPRFEPQGFAERSVLDELERWSEPLLGRGDRLRACFRLELPEPGREAFVLRFMLQSPEDPSLLVLASEIWQVSGQTLQRLGKAFREPQEALLEALGRAAPLFAPLAAVLSQRAPESIELDPHAAWEFLGDGAAALAEAGFGVIVPSELTARGARRLRLRMRVGGTAQAAGKVSGVAALGLDELLRVDYGALIGDEAVSRGDLAELARQKAPLVRFRGAWVAVDPRELAEIQRRMDQAPGRVSLREAVQAALAGESRQGELVAVVAAAGSFAELLERLGQSTSLELAAPPELQATLRPYQLRGQSWLSNMGALGLGACLADDMGLGKTIQLLAHLLRRAAAPGARRPALLVAPTSVVGNWEREIERFAPSLRVARHYGGERTRAASELAASDRLVLTSYAVLRRDAALLGAVEWSAVVLDEAQNIKNSASATARAARALRAGERFALTGTPVENRLAELWSIFEFINPGLLGPLEKFRREFAVPVERYGNESVAKRLRRVTAPFILRRLKSDPSIIDDLPAKNEMKVVCTLTREQASLYKAVVDEELRRIERADAMERRGRVLALLTATKQICNHPAQYLGERGPLAGRSGKLARVTEMLEEVVLSGDKALIFTQFREMGERLVEHLGGELGREVLFLHGATPKAARDAMLRRFQDGATDPALFVLSLKAGGTGLDLTAASHVFHYDRWWNPAVEDQATDRAYRIGQRRAVQVHKLVCAGSVEDKIDQLLERKRVLASRVVGSGERWITELETDELRELFALSGAAVAEADEGETGEDGAAETRGAEPDGAAARKRGRARRKERA
jgi:superfamily II DNA or RNA helicase